MFDNLHLGQDCGRRDFLKLAAGSVAFPAVSPWLNAEEPAVRPRQPARKACIMIFLSGGLSHLESFDWKQGVSEYPPIQTAVPGIQICELFPKVGKLMNHCAIIRSMSTPENDHLRATYLAHTCQRPGTPVYPSIGAIVGKDHLVTCHFQSSVNSYQ